MFWEYVFFLISLTHQYAYLCVPGSCALGLNSFWYRRDKEANKTVSQSLNDMACESEQPKLENARNVPATLRKNETWKMWLEKANATLPVWCFQFHTTAEEVPAASVQQDIAALLLLSAEEPDSFLFTELIGACGWFVLPQRHWNMSANLDISCLLWQNESDIISPRLSCSRTTANSSCYLLEIDLISWVSVQSYLYSSDF